MYKFYHNRQYNVYTRLMNIINDGKHYNAIVIVKYIYNIV